jgi:hypothetical protein
MIEDSMNGRLIQVGDVCNRASAGINASEVGAYGTGRMGEAVGGAVHLGRRHPCGGYRRSLGLRSHVRLFGR